MVNYVYMHVHTCNVAICLHCQSNACGTGVITWGPFLR